MNIKTHLRSVALFIATSTVLIPSFAQEQKRSDAPAKPVPKVATPEQFKRAMERRNGGIIRDTREQKGCVTVVNSQNKISADLLNKVARTFAGELQIDIEVVNGAFDLGAPSVTGEASLFVVSDEKLPMSLVAPESRWAMVNVSPLDNGKPAFLQARSEKMVRRGLAYLLGAADSRYPLSLTTCITKPEDLDGLSIMEFPVDIMEAMRKYPAGYGIKPYRTTTYRAACEEGWAPAPTNDVQKAIWNKVHEMPTAPIKIKPETKKVKE